MDDCGGRKHSTRGANECVVCVCRLQPSKPEAHHTHASHAIGVLERACMLNDAVGENTGNSVRMSVVCVCVVQLASRPQALITHTSHVNWFTTDNSSRKSAPVYARRPCEGRRVRATLRVWVKGAPQIGCRAVGNPSGK